MMDLNLDRSIFELTEENPQLVQHLVALGFDQMANPVVRKTVGRTMTLALGCKMKGIPLEHVQASLEALGYRLINHGKDGEK